ncbi:Aurofusarin cluster transcription factor aurR2 [Paramyrothecium foliicola]|nr:Aurofusarin cluster transcription factor aurR2 [Paramyrothecium foliicola]
MQQSSPSSVNSNAPDPNSRRRRKPLNCEPCRHSKLRCDRQLPCNTCVKRGWQGQCAYGNSPATTDGPRRRRTRHTVIQQVPQPQEQLISPSEPHSSRSASPEPIQRRWDNILRRPPITKNPPTSSTTVSCTLSFGPKVDMPELLGMLPPDTVVEYLVSRYFATICSLFRVLHGPTFQKQYAAFLANPRQVDLSYLALVFAICSLALKTTPPTDDGLSELWQGQPMPRDLSALSQQYRNAAMMSLAQDQFLVRHNLNTLEALLILLQTITDIEGAEYGWALLGNALNIAIALRCHVDSSDPACIERERRRRCWAGVLFLHMDQALLFRDTDMTYLWNMKAPLPADVNDADILEDVILTRPGNGAANELTQMSYMRFQLQLFRLSNDICNYISSPDRLNDEDSLVRLDAAIAAEQQRWDSAYLVDGARSVIDTAGYAHWCIMQVYAHQLYLLLHRPWHNSRSCQGRFRPQSRDRCVKSSLALMDIHRQLCELPRLKCYRWLVKGTICCIALHGAVALTSCMLDPVHGSELSEHISVIDSAVQRLERLRGASPACATVYTIMRHLQSRFTRAPEPAPAEDPVETRFDDWITNIDWFRPDDLGWDFWDGDFTTPQTDDPMTATTGATTGT